MPSRYNLAVAVAKAAEEPSKMEIFTVVNEGFQLEDLELQNVPSANGEWSAGDAETDDSFSMGTTTTITAEEAGAPPTRGSRWRQHMAALLAALSAVSVGYVDAWTANALPFLQSPAEVPNGTDSKSAADTLSPFIYGQPSTPLYRKFWASPRTAPAKEWQGNVSIDMLISPDGAKGLPSPFEANVVDGVIHGITSEQASWLSSMVPIGAMVGSIPGGMLADMFGRKTTLLVMTAPCLVSWLIIIFFSNSVELLYLSRGIAGIIMGIVLVVVPLYNEEIAEVSVRGAIGVYQNMMVTVGILIGYMVGAFVPYLWTAIIPCIIPIIMFLTFIWMPESPTYLVSIGRGGDAHRVIKWLRGGKSDLGADVTQVTESARRARSGKLVPVPLLVQRIARALTQQPSAYALWVVFLLMVFRQLTGLHAVVFYTVEIFEDAKSVVPAPYAAIIIGVVEVIATYLASVLVDRWGRRFLLLTSAVGTTACHASLAMYYAFLHHGYDLDDFSWLPLLFIALFIVNCACGFGPLPWFMMAELTPTEHKNWAAGMTGFLNWGSMFLVLKLFPTLTTYLGEYVAFAIFSLNCLLASFFVFFWVPETKGKTLEEIQNEIAESRGH